MVLEVASEEYQGPASHFLGVCEKVCFNIGTLCYVVKNATDLHSCFQQRAYVSACMHVCVPVFAHVHVCWVRGSACDKSFGFNCLYD